jgi:alpha-beta hydrolase superfamily lysophospholipase
VLYEYPGYGLCNEDQYTEEGVYFNIRKVYRYVTEDLNFKPNEVVLYGHSLGTGPSVDLASDHQFPVGGVVLQAPFLSILRVVSTVHILF